MVFPLITTASGDKMGKTAEGAIWLDPKLTSPYEYYQYWINTDDRDVERFLALFTFLPLEEVKRYGKLTGADIREAKEVYLLVQKEQVNKAAPIKNLKMLAASRHQDHPRRGGGREGARGVTKRFR
jgi:tyrosyl-tRNA synthetase